MSDLISRADAVKALTEYYDYSERMCIEIKALIEDIPSAELPKGDLISRADVLKYPIRLNHYDEENGSREFVYGVESVIEYVESLPSADAVEVDRTSEWVAVRREEYEDFLASADAEFTDLPDIPRYYYERIVGNMAHEINMLKEQLESAEAESDDLIIKGAKGIKDGLYNIKDGKFFQYKANGGTVRTYPIVQSSDAEPKRVLQGYFKGANTIQTIRHEELQSIANTRKAVELADAVQGEWIEREDWNGDYYYDCSVCGESFVLCDGTPSMNLYHFCPNCGARMKGGGE